MHRIRMATALFILIGTQSCIAQSFHWRLALPGIWNSVAFNPHSNGNVIFAGSAFADSIYRSDDGGYTWHKHGGGSYNFIIATVKQIFCLPSDTSVVLAVTPNDFYRSSDGGLTWYDSYNGGALTLGGVDGESIGYNAAEDAIYYGENFGHGVWRSDDHGSTWRLTGGLFPDSITLCSMGVSSDTPPFLVQGTEGSGGILAHSTNEGQSWLVTLRGPETDIVECPKIVFSWNAISPVTGSHSIAISTRWPTRDTNMVATTDGGATWQVLLAPNRTWALDIDQRKEMTSSPADPAYPLPLHFFAGLFDVRPDTVPGGLIQETTDGGRTWRSTGFPSSDSLLEAWVMKYDTLSGRLAVATDSGIYIGDPANGSVAERESNDSIQFLQNAN